jgi:uncharacterized delta-60 repeat protein
MKKIFFTFLVFTFKCILFTNFCSAQSAGTLDSTFGINGIVNTVIVGGTNGTPGALTLAVQNDGKIILGGGFNFNFGLIRYDTCGIIDSTFGINGIVNVQVGGSNCYIRALAIQTDGKILAAGSLLGEVGAARFKTNGSLDSLFGINGLACVSVIPTWNQGTNDVKIQSDGKIVVAGFSTSGNPDSDFVLVRFNTNGTIDYPFGSSGISHTGVDGSQSYANALAIQPDGKLVAVGAVDNGTNDDFAMIRCKTNADMDSTFGFNGQVSTSLSAGDDIAYSVALQTDGKIVVAGRSGGDFALTRYKINGTLDSTFGTYGKVTTSLTSYSDCAFKVAIQPNGKIVAAGAANNLFGVVRYNSDGTLDSLFGTNGIFKQSVGGWPSYAKGLAILNNGKIMVGGKVQHVGGGYNFAAMRLKGADILTGIDEPKRKCDLIVYPNPASDNLTIASPEKATIEIYNLEGQILKTINVAGKQTTIDIRNLSSGIYIIKAKTEKGVAVKKFIKE